VVLETHFEMDTRRGMEQQAVICDGRQSSQDMQHGTKSVRIPAAMYSGLDGNLTSLFELLR